MYRPVLILFALVDGLHRLLKVQYLIIACCYIMCGSGIQTVFFIITLFVAEISLCYTGPELIGAMLEFIRNNDAVIGESCDKV